MAPFIVVALLLAAQIASARPAHATDAAGAPPTDPRREQVAIALEELRHELAKRFPSEFAVVCGNRFETMSSGRPVSLPLPIQANHFYAVAAACDGRCEALTLALYDGNGLIQVHGGVGARPITVADGLGRSAGQMAEIRIALTCTTSTCVAGWTLRVVPQTEPRRGQQPDVLGCPVQQ